MERDYAASFGRSKVMHAIRGEWDYSHIADARTVCGRKGPFNTNHRSAGPMTITCKSCQNLSNNEERINVRIRLQKLQA